MYATDKTKPVSANATTSNPRPHANTIRITRSAALRNSTEVINSRRVTKPDRIGWEAYTARG